VAEAERQVYGDAVEVAGRLHDLGVSQSVLQEALQTGLRHAFACTRHDPPSLPGILAWGKTVRHLRDRLVPAGWEISNASNYATVIHPGGGFAIAVAAGNVHTGVGDANPSTRAEKGPATRSAVQENQLTFFDVRESFPPPRREPGKQTWLLLHYADEEAGEIRAELSLPADMTDDGYVADWRERIILEPVPFGQATLPREGGDSGEIDIEIEPRGQ
jgi:hypothetical protein